MSSVELRLDPANAPGLTDSDRDRLGALADLLVAGGAGMPSATGADVHTQWIDRVMAVRRDLAAAVRAVLARDGAPEQVLEGLRAADPELFSGFAFAVAGAYLINPRVRRELGYPGPAPMKNPALPGEAESYLEDGLLDVVVERGPLYRPTPEA